MTKSSRFSFGLDFFFFFSFSPFFPFCSRTSRQYVADLAVWQEDLEGICAGKGCWRTPQGGGTCTWHSPICAACWEAAAGTPWPPKHTWALVQHLLICTAQTPQNCRAQMQWHAASSVTCAEVCSLTRVSFRMYMKPNGMHHWNVTCLFPKGCMFVPCPQSCLAMCYMLSSCCWSSVCEN